MSSRASSRRESNSRCSSSTRTGLLQLLAISIRLFRPSYSHRAGSRFPLARISSSFLRAHSMMLAAIGSIFVGTLIADAHQVQRIVALDLCDGECESVQRCDPLEIHIGKHLHVGEIGLAQFFERTEIGASLRP